MKFNFKQIKLKFLAIFLDLIYYFNMRVVSGKYRGKILNEFDLESTKPTIDRVKESIFNLIQFDVADAVVLDLFSGTGALGIEAISRGAKLTHLVEINNQAIKIIKSNLKGVSENFELFNQDFKLFLNTTKIKYDIVLLDPPYKTNFGIEAIELLINNQLLNDGAIIIFETSIDNKFDLKFPEFEIVSKKYGKVAVYKMVRK